MLCRSLFHSTKLVSSICVKAAWTSRSAEDQSLLPPAPFAWSLKEGSRMRLQNKLAGRRRLKTIAMFTMLRVSFFAAAAAPTSLIQLSQHWESDINRRRKRGDVFALASGRFSLKRRRASYHKETLQAAENDSGGGFFFSRRISESSVLKAHWATLCLLCAGALKLASQWHFSSFFFHCSLFI